MDQKRTIPLEEYLDKTFAKGNRGEDPDAVPPRTPQDYIDRVMKGDALVSMKIGSVEGLGLQPSERMGNDPAWLGEAPEITDIAYVVEGDALVVGAGPSGSVAALRLAEKAVNVICLETQTWAEYDAFACDMASYNSEFFRDLGAPEYDLMEIYNEYMRKSLGHVHPKLVRDYVTRSGEMLDWVLRYIPKEYIDSYAHPTNYRGNRYYTGETCGQKSFIGMLQWRDEKTNNNMWPFVMRSLHTEAQKMGARFIYGAQAIRLVQAEDGTVTGCIARDIDGKFFLVRCRAAVISAGDYGGNPDMLLDLNDSLRNLAWSLGLDRTDPKSIVSGGRDGSGIRMCMWAGGTMEAGPRAGQGCMATERPALPFGGCWTTFGPDGRRFMNETLVKFGANAAFDMLPKGGIVASVVDSHWDEYYEYQGYGHECMDRCNEHMMSTVRREMAEYKTGPEGFDVHNFSRYGESYDHIWAADTIEELGSYLGYTGEALDHFILETAHWNEMCEAGKDTDWGCDPSYMFPIKDAPFFGIAMRVGDELPSGGLCQHGGICTNGSYQVLDSEKHPIPGLYAAGNTCGQRYGVQYHTPTAGNCCGSAMTSGYVAAEYVARQIKG